MSRTSDESAAADGLIELWLAEDLGTIGDLTAIATIPADVAGSGSSPGARCHRGSSGCASAATRMGLDLGGWQATGDDGVGRTRVQVARTPGCCRDLLRFERPLTSSNT